MKCSTGSRGNLGEELIMVGVLLFIDEHEAGR